MKKILGAVMVFAVSLCLAISAQAFEFSADVVSTADGNSIRGKAYISPKATRMEVPGIGATISRTDKKVVWVLMDRERMYMEQPFNPNMAASVSEKAEGEVERTLIGSEKIDDRSTKKYNVVVMGAEGRAEMYQWIDDATGIPIRTASQNGEWSTEFRNFSPGPQDPALFEIPAGYKKFEIPNMNDIKAMAQQYGSE